MNDRLEMAFRELEYEDDLAIKTILFQTEAEHLKQEIVELKKLLFEYEIQLRKRNEMLAKIHAATM